MAAVRRPDGHADHRNRAARPMGKSIPALPCRARRNSGTLTAALFGTRLAVPALAIAGLAIAGLAVARFTEIQAASLGSLPLAGAALAPPLDTPTSAGRSTRSPIM